MVISTKDVLYLHKEEFAKQIHSVIKFTKIVSLLLSSSSSSVAVGGQSLSHVQLFVTPSSAACQAPLSMGISRQEYWSGLLFLSARDLPGPRTEPISPALAGRFFTTESLRKPSVVVI